MNKIKASRCKGCFCLNLSSNHLSQAEILSLHTIVLDRRKQMRIFKGDLRTLGSTWQSKVAIINGKDDELEKQRHNEE